MKKLLSFLFLLASLSGCSRKGSDPAPTPAPSDPFLGHWHGDRMRTVVYNSNGTVKTDEAVRVTSALDITPTTISITSTVNGRNSTEVNTYTRSGERLTVIPPSGNPGKESVYARSLTAGSFTMEFDSPVESGKTYYIQSIYYQR